MIEKELYHRPTVLEKGLWWAQVGGLVAGLLGVINHWADWAVKGAVVFVGSKFALDKFSQSRRDNPSSST